MRRVVKHRRLNYHFYLLLHVIVQTTTYAKETEERKNGPMSETRGPGCMVWIGI